MDPTSLLPNFFTEWRDDWGGRWSSGDAGTPWGWDHLEDLVWRGQILEVL